MDENQLTCTIYMEWANSGGEIIRKVTYKTALLRLTRAAENRSVYIEITSGKSSAIRLELKALSLHNRFMSEGKACIKFQELNCSVFISNAPPSQLLVFLRTISVKIAGKKVADNPNTSLRTQLLTGKPKEFNDISPVTESDLVKARAKALGGQKGTDTTPSPLSRKRKNSGESAGKLAQKRLYSSSPIQEEQLNAEQKEVLDACLAGKNVFFTGSAGTGKSFLLRKIISALPPDVTQATASTGVAACHIGGVTLHQFAGIGTGETALGRNVELFAKSTAASIWRRCKHLIIDEVSMIDGEYFDKIESVARFVRRSEKPFGGIQVILCGDFFQLPPIGQKANFSQNRQSHSQDSKQTTPFAFQAKNWDKCIDVAFELTQVHRQCDPLFIRILNNIRLGKVTEEAAETLTATVKQKIEVSGILATRLCSHTREADEINNGKLNNLQGEERCYDSTDSDSHLSAQLDTQTPVGRRLVLKVGAQVMLLKNLSVSAGLVNGARGVVTHFEASLPYVKFRNKLYACKPEKFPVKTAGGLSISRTQIPLRLAWAFSIHKSQGLTLDCVEMALGRVFEAGQAYVALSRAQSLQTLRVLDFKRSQVWADPRVLKFHAELHKRLEEGRFYVLGDKSNVQQQKEVKLNAVKKLVNKKLFSSKKPLVTIS